MHDGRIKGFKEKSLHGKFRKSTKAIAHKRLQEWLKTYEKKGRDAIIAAVQDQALLKTN